MERNDVIKALENAIRMAKFHSYMTPKISYEELKETIALIRELTGENGQLRLDVEVCGAELSRYTENVAKMVEETKADIVHKLVDRFLILLEEEYKEYTPEGAICFFKNGSSMMYGAAKRLIYQVAKELLGGEQK